MFDLRYHVASLTAVFVALVIGILVGVGLSGKGFVNDAERTNLNGRIAGPAARARRRASSRSSPRRAAPQALKSFADAAYPAVVPGRLEGKKVAVLFVGPVDQGVAFTCRARRSRDAGGTVVRTRSISVPLDTAAIQDALRARAGVPPLPGRGAPRRARQRARARARRRRQDAALGRSRQDHRPGARGAVDAAGGRRRRRPLGRAAAGRDEGVPRRALRRASRARASPPSGRRRRARRRARFPRSALAGLSTVDSVDTSAGRLGLVLLLGGAEPGSYGVREPAKDGVLPPIPPVPPQG